MKPNRKVIQLRLVPSSPEQQVVMQYLTNQYGNELISGLRQAVWMHLLDAYLLDALYAKRVPMMDMQHEAQRVTAQLVGRLASVEHLLALCYKHDGWSQLSSTNHHQMIQSFERLLGSSTTGLEADDSLDDPPFDAADLELDNDDYEPDDQMDADSNSGFNLRQLADDAYQYRWNQLGQHPPNADDDTSDDPGDMP